MAEETQPEEVTALEIWDRTEARSLLNVVPPALQAAFLDASKNHPEYFGLDERALWKRLSSDGARPSQTDNAIRAKFWFEYESASSEGRKFEVQRVYAGICTRQFFYKNYLSNNSKMAWLSCPPLDFQIKLEEAVSFGNERMRDILELDPESWSHRKNEQLKLMELQAKIYTMLDQRRHGAFTQKIEQKNMNLNVSTSDKAVASHLVGATMEQLDKRLKELDRRERAALNLPESHEPGVIEAEVVPSDE